MKSNSILDSRLWIRLDLDVSLKANSLFQTNPNNRAHFASQLLLYDRIVIPTKDFGILPILISWMGLSSFEEALKTDTINFVRPKSLLAYVGNGNALSGIVIDDTPKSPHSWHSACIYGSFEDAPDIQLRYQCPFISLKQRRRLVNLILEKSSEFDWNNKFFMEKIVHESYTDIIENPDLLKFVLSHEPAGKKSVKLTHLSGVTKNSARVLNLNHIRDGVDLVLRVAEINLEILMAHRHAESDLGTSEGADFILREKLKRSGAKIDLLNKFQNLLELENIPDIRIIVASGEINLSEIWNLRQSKEARRFRQWIHEASPDDARELEKAYVSVLGGSSKYSSLPIRVIRFVLTTAISSLEPFSGTIINATDSFFTEKWLEGYSPRLFMDSIRALPGLSNRNNAE